MELKAAEGLNEPLSYFHTAICTLGQPEQFLFQQQSKSQSGLDAANQFNQEFPRAALLAEGKT